MSIAEPLGSLFVGLEHNKEEGAIYLKNSPHINDMLAKSTGTQKEKE